MKFLPWVLAILLIFSVLPAAGEFYKYVDENGNTRFTDDINQVPPQQRQGISSYVESESKPETTAPEPDSDVPEPAAKKQNAADIYAEEKAEDGYYEKTRRELDQMKSEIDAEFEALNVEKEKLTSERENANSRDQIQEYNKKVTQLNERAAAYEAKGAEYEKKVGEFNAKIAEENKKSK